VVGWWMERLTAQMIGQPDGVDVNEIIVRPIAAH